MRDADSETNQPRGSTIDYTVIQDLLTEENVTLSDGNVIERVRGGTKKIAQIVAQHLNTFGDTGPFETYCDVFERLLSLSRKSEDTYNMFYKKSIGILDKLPTNLENGEIEIIDRYAELIKYVSMMSTAKKVNELNSILHSTKIDLTDEAAFKELLTTFDQYL